jgi:hypothetical protein
LTLTGCDTITGLSLFDVGVEVSLASNAHVGQISQLSIDAIGIL